MNYDSGYFGSDFSEDTYEAILANRWSKQSVKQELGLFSRKDWNVRHLHPVKATFLFADIFTNEVRSVIRKHIDNTPARVTASGRVLDWYPLKAGDIFDPPSGDPAAFARWKTMVKKLIEARQMADKLGIPYEFFIRTGLRHYYFGRLYLLSGQLGPDGKPERKKLPSPGMLVTEECLAYIAEHWLDYLGSRIHYGTHERYLIANDEGHSDTREHQQNILNQIARKPDPIPAIRTFVGKGLISPEMVESRFGQAVREKALGSVVT